MKRIAPPSPVDHPNAYAGFSVAGVAGLLVYEAKTRLNMDVTTQEALFIVSAVVWLTLYLGGKRGK